MALVSGEQTVTTAMIDAARATADLVPPKAGTPATRLNNAAVPRDAE